MLSENINNFKDSFWDGIEDSDEDNENQLTEKYLYSLVSGLSEKGILFHDVSEVITEGGMKSVIVFFNTFFDSEKLLIFLNTLPTSLVDEISQLVISDEPNDDELLFEFLFLLYRELPSNGDFEILLHYQDIYYCDGLFKQYIENVLKIYRDEFKLQTISLVTEDEIKNYSELVYKHREHVIKIINSILDKSNNLFPGFDLESCINHDNDLLRNGVIEYLALDKNLYPNENYHTFKTHPAIDLFHEHKTKSPHHVEYYITNHKFINNFEYVKYIPVVIADMFVLGDSLDTFKKRVEDTMKDLLIYDNEFGENIDIENILSLITSLPNK